MSALVEVNKEKDFLKNNIKHFWIFSIEKKLVDEIAPFSKKDWKVVTWESSYEGFTPLEQFWVIFAFCFWQFCMFGDLF